jgi:hypothetical protein
MKLNCKVFFPIALFIVFTLGCAPILQTSASRDSQHYGIGQRDIEGKATGEWKLYAKANKSLFGEGRYVNGMPDGTWTLWDTGGTKNAELHFNNGVLNGEYRLFYSSFSPEAAGKLKTIGHANQGLLDGVFRRYNADGTSFVEYSAMDESVSDVSVGSFNNANGQLSADRNLLDLYIDTIVQIPQKE